MENSESDKNNQLFISPEEQDSVFNIAHKQPHEKLSNFWLRFLLPNSLCAAAFLVFSLVVLLTKQSFSVLILQGCLLAFALLVAYTSLLLVQLKSEFILRKNSLTLPAIYFMASGWRLTWNWDNLIRVAFSRSNDRIEKADQLVLTFEEDHTHKQFNIHIGLKDIDQLDLKKLVYAIVNSAPGAAFTPPINEVALEFPTVSGIKQINFQDFTSLWDEEFSTRYSPTLFVPLQAGHKLRNGSITISELAACGGSAAIYSAQDSQEVHIIVKEAVIPKHSPQAVKDKALELFNREAFLLSKLDHPNIAKVLDHFVENDHHYEIIEYIDGLDLRRFVKERGPQPAEFVLNWLEQICEILDYLHNQNPPIMHRDLTPDNLVLRIDGSLVLIDFGAANAFVGTATGTMVGKQSYMAPEQIRGKSAPQSDIYSLGCTSYFLLTGKDPTPLETSQVDLQTGLTQSINTFLARCTALELNERYQSASAALEKIRTMRAEMQYEAIADPIHHR